MVDPKGLANKGIQAMNTEQTELYKRIQAFSLDESDAQLSFSKRLARDNGWSLQYAQQAIEEYKKFAFLAVAAGHPVTPSDQVDRVWHLHLTYTRSYWDEFCSEVLQTPLHHDPTLGGEAENQKFDDWYRKTLESYERFFGVEPPVEIWFKPNDHFVRVNTQQNLVLSKKAVTTSIAIIFTFVLNGYFIGNSRDNINPFAGGLLVVICVTVAFGLIRFLVRIENFTKNPSPPRTKGSWGGGDCGSAGCGGWGDSSGHSSGDSSGNDCGGGGCGGGGCGSG